MSIEHLTELLDQADPFDYDDGKRAYIRYHDLMHAIALHYDCPFERVVAAFCALSPNNDYVGNLRSLVTMLSYRKQVRDPMEATVSTYRHCQQRAYKYMVEGAPFLQYTTGLKTRSFYLNIVDPTHWGPVTIDGHMILAWRGEDGTMTDAQQKMSRGLYKLIAEDITTLAIAHRMLPHQMQAILWFTRKRVKRVKYDPQLDLLNLDGGAQKTVFRVEDIKPYTSAPCP